MRFIYGSPETIFAELCRMHEKESPFALLLSTTERCETFRRLLRENFGRDLTTPGRFSARHDGDEVEWIVTTPGRVVLTEARSCVLEDGASGGSADLHDAKIPNCMGILHVHWGPGGSPPARVNGRIDKFTRGARACTCYGMLLFFLLFFIAVLWESWH